MVQLLELEGPGDPRNTELTSQHQLNIFTRPGIVGWFRLLLEISVIWLYLVSLFSPMNV